MIVFIRYFLSGAIAVAVHFAVMVILVEGFTSSPVIASGAGFCIGSFVNYQLQYGWTFASEYSHRQAGIRYILVTTSMLLLNMVLFKLMLSGLALNYVIAQFGATAVVFLANFTVNSNYTFQQQNS